MEYALRRKFARGTTWHKKLMDTGTEEIVENNNWGDQFWGFDVVENKGENHLGKILMHIRQEFTETKLVNYKKSNDIGVSIMRGSPWGNPYYFGFTSDPNAIRVDSREEAVSKFRDYFLNRINSDSDFKERTLELKNKTLRCCCKPLICHGDVILDWLFLQNSYKKV